MVVRGWIDEDHRKNGASCISRVRPNFGWLCVGEVDFLEVFLWCRKLWESAI